MISKMEMENWNTTSKLRNLLPLWPAGVSPLSTLTGLKAERKNAGYAPASNPITRVIPAIEGNTHAKVLTVMARLLPDMLLNKGSSAQASNTAARVAKKLISTDSE